MTEEHKDDTPIADKVVETPNPVHDDKNKVTTDHDDTLKETVGRLETAVASLTEQVASLTTANTVEQEQDTSPIKGPWTHRRWGAK